jgi:hypothetical protein
VDALKSIVISLFHQLYHFDTIQEYHVTFSLNHIRDFRTRGDNCRSEISDLQLYRGIHY